MLGAITIVGVLHYVLARSLATPVEETLWLRQVSYGAILAIGLAMVTMALRDRRAIALAGAGARGQIPGPGSEAHCGHAHSVRGLREQRLLAVAAGFIPCTGAILILVFAFTNGILLIGIAMALFIAIGMGLTLAALGIASVLAHHHVRSRIAAGRGMETFLSLLGPLLITAIGLVLLSGALLQGGPS